MKARRWMMLGALAFACADEPPPPSGSFARPSGLAYVEREPESGAKRADIFVADSEAEGVRVVQLRQRLDEAGAPVDEHTLVPGLAALFPIAVSAPGFPTRLAISSDGNRLFVLAPAKSSIHVLDVRPLPYGASAAQTDALVRLGTIDLPSVLAQSIILTDLAVLPSADADRLVVVGRTEQDDGVVVALEVAAGGATVNKVELVEGLEAPTTILVHGSELVISSPTSSSVAIARVRTSTEAGILGALRFEDVGGPTDGLVDAGASGVLALRLDRTSAVVLSEANGTLARSTQLFAGSPYTPDEERSDPDLGGRIDLRGPRVISGATARLASFIHPSDVQKKKEEQRDLLAGKLDDQGLGNVVLLMHADARATFLIGPMFDIFIPVQPYVTTMRMDAALAEPACGKVEELCGQTVGTSCSGVEVTIDPEASERRYTIEYRGRVSAGKGGELMPKPGGFVFVPDGADVSLVQPGDAIGIALTSRENCDSEQRVSIATTGTVTAVGEQQIEVAFELAVPRCPSDPLELLEFEIRASKNGVSVSEVDGLGRFVRVLERVATASTANARASLAVPAALTMTTTSTSTAFTCRAVEPICFSDDDCTTSCDAAKDECPRRCLQCPESDPSCLRLRSLECSRIEVVVPASPAFVLDASVPGSFFAAVPDRMVFSPMRGSWFASFPGARGLSETVLSAAEGLLNDIIR
ncbi:MAG: hypothetical protein HY791_28755 [Deltaproteobacteria bacterium]|nr:hypothetical protein [Deltaproteobacteria bacterium]